jgi:hypothetical protein
LVTKTKAYSYKINILYSVSETAQSSTWRFYNAGDAVESYAPFPAEIISPTMAESISTSDNVITLDWIGSDIDDDIIGYDVYFGTSTTPEIIESDLNESILNNVSIVSNTIYYWKIITKDAGVIVQILGFFSLRFCNNTVVINKSSKQIIPHTYLSVGKHYASLLLRFL